MLDCRKLLFRPLKIPGRPRIFTRQKIPSQKALLPNPMATGFKPNIAHNPNTQVQPRTLTSAKGAEKLAKGLCFFCDQHYERGHKDNIKKTQLFLIEIPVEHDEELAELGEETVEDLGESEEDQPQISMHALSGGQSF